MMGGVIAGRAAALAVARVEALRLDDEVEALEVLEGDGHAVPAALLRLATALAATATVKRQQLLASVQRAPRTLVKVDVVAVVVIGEVRRVHVKRS